MVLIGYLVVSAGVALVGGYLIYGWQDSAISCLLIAWLPTSLWVVLRSRGNEGFAQTFGWPLAAMLLVIGFMARGHIG